MQRSGTTWLANILNSHPSVLYLHEPIWKSGTVRCHGSISPSQRQQLLDRYSLPSADACRPPFFPKQFNPQSPGLRWLVWLAVRTTGLGQGLFRRLSAPVPAARYDLVLKDTWTHSAIDLVHALDARLIVVLRHPCDTVRSILRGQQQGLMPVVDRAGLFKVHAQLWTEAGFPWEVVAAAEEYEFQAMWWLANSLMLTRAVDSWPHSYLLTYEDLCRDPAGQVQMLFDFLGWQVTPQTARFLAQSQSERWPWLRALLQVKHSYYALYRRSDREQEQSRRLLTDRQVDRVMAIASNFPRMDLWAAKKT